MTKQEFLEHLRGSENFDESFKQMWIARIETEGLTPTVIAELRDAIGNKITETYAEVGVEEDPNDPEYIAEHQKVMTELQKIDDELEAGLASMKDEADQVFQSTVKQMEEDSAQSIRDSI